MTIEKGISTFRNLLTKDAIFQIPLYQRQYSWTRKQLQDLWDDLFYLDPGKNHFYGTILLRSTKARIRRRIKVFDTYEVIDGQQRIVTSLILLKVILSKLEKKKRLKKDVELEKKLYLKFDDIHKVRLLGDDEKFFREYIVDEVKFPDVALTPSQKRLKRAKKFFQERADKIDVKTLQDLKLKIDNMEILSYPVEKESDAARTFTVINDRGKILTKLEKTKSSLMYMIYLSSPADLVEEDLKRIHERFLIIFRCIVEIEHPAWGQSLRDKEDEIQRYHFILYEDEKRISKSYKRGQIDRATREKASGKYMELMKQQLTALYRKDSEKCRKEVLEYVADLERAFIALKEITSYNEKDRVWKLLDKIFRLGMVGNLYPLLIACWIQFKNKPDFEDILGAVEKFVFRIYVLGGYRTHTRRNQLYGLARKTHLGKLDSASLIRELKSITLEYAPFSWLKDQLKDESFATKIMAPRSTKYLLFEYETYLRE